MSLGHPLSVSVCVSMCVCNDWLTWSASRTAVSYYIRECSCVILHTLCSSGESSDGALALFFFTLLLWYPSNPKYHTVFAQLCHITYASGESRDVMKTPKSSAAKTSLPGQLFVGRAGPGTPPMVYPKVCLRVSALCLRAVSVGVDGMGGL